MIASDLTQSQEVQHIAVRGLSQDGYGAPQASSQLKSQGHSNSHQPILRRIDITQISSNALDHQASVAKTAMHKRRNGALGAGHLAELTDGPRGISNTYDSSLAPHAADLTVGNIRQGRSSHHSNPTGLKAKHDELMSMASGPPPAVRYSRNEQAQSGAASNENQYPNFFDEFLQGANNGTATGTGLRNRPSQFSSIGGQPATAIQASGRHSTNRGGVQYTNSMMASISNGHNSASGYDSSQMSVGAMIAGHSGARYEQRANLNGKKNLNIFDANASYALQKQMNSSRFGGFRTADGTSQSKQLGNMHQNSNVGGGAEETFGFVRHH